jgi:hypothetical protein
MQVAVVAVLLIGLIRLEMEECPAILVKVAAVEEV